MDASAHSVQGRHWSPSRAGYWSPLSHSSSPYSGYGFLNHELAGAGVLRSLSGGVHEALFPAFC